MKKLLFLGLLAINMNTQPIFNKESLKWGVEKTFKVTLVLKVFWESLRIYIGNSYYQKQLEKKVVNKKLYDKTKSYIQSLASKSNVNAKIFLYPFCNEGIHSLKEAILIPYSGMRGIKNYESALLHEIGHIKHNDHSNRVKARILTTLTPLLMAHFMKRSKPVETLFYTSCMGYLTSLLYEQYQEYRADSNALQYSSLEGLEHLKSQFKRLTIVESINKMRLVLDKDEHEYGITDSFPNIKDIATCNQLKNRLMKKIHNQNKFIEYKLRSFFSNLYKMATSPHQSNSYRIKRIGKRIEEIKKTPPTLLP